MVSLQVVRVEWRGLPTGPGVSTFYGDDSAASIKPYVGSLFEAIAIKTPSSLSFRILNTGNVIDSATGLATGTWTDGTTATIACTGSGGWAAPVGGLIRWETSLFTAGRRLVGKTFLVPLVSSCFDTSGNLVSTVISDLEDAAALYVDGAVGARVYSRTQHTVSSIVTSGVPDEAVVLRSRRD